MCSPEQSPALPLSFTLQDVHQRLVELLLDESIHGSMWMVPTQGSEAREEVCPLLGPRAKLLHLRSPTRGHTSVSLHLHTAAHHCPLQIAHNATEFRKI